MGILLNSYIAFDLEGPLSPRDNAYDLMGLFPGGDRIFEVISRYDDLLALEGKPGYQPGDTLALIVPFLFLHGLSEANIRALAEKASLTGGAAKLVSWLAERRWNIFCITTTYEQYAARLAARLGIAPGNIACTGFPLDSLGAVARPEEMEIVRRAEADILSIQAGDDERIKRRLDAFFWETLPATSIGGVIARVKPCGGQRKADALARFAEAHARPVSRWVAVGDSITDCRMLETVDRAGGLAIAFNGNEYAVPSATMCLASRSLAALAPVLEAWEKGGRSGAEEMVKRLESRNAGSVARYFWLAGRRDLAEPISVSKAMRRAMRDEAGKLG